MTHTDKGRYAAKHAPGGKPDGTIAAAVRLRAKDGKITCTDAERIGAETGAAMAEIGRTVDLLEIHISHCQLGLFGHAPVGKNVRPGDQVAPGLGEAIRSRLSDGRLPCAAAGGIAAGMKIPRLKISSACEALQIKIKPCQLGAF